MSIFGSIEINTLRYFWQMKALPKHFPPNKSSYLLTLNPRSMKTI